MLTFRILGSVALAGEDGAEVDALLRQTKHLALLAYLALPRPGTWHRRDTLLAIFWPELDEARARTALRSALHLLRRHLGADTVRNRGTGEVGLAPEALETDVGRLRDAAAAGRHADALACYAGELLPALHVDDADEFQRWLAGERAALHALARRSASALAREREQAGDLVEATDAARRAVALDPDDESVARALIALLDRAGDRAQAFAAYERLRTHLGAEFGTRPSAETLALVEAVRTRRAVAPASAADTPGAAPAADASAPPGVAAPMTATRPPVEPTPVAAVPAQPALVPATPPGATPGRARPWRRLYWRWGAAASVIAVVATVLAPRARSHASASAPPARPAVPRLLVLPPENATRDATQEYLATGVSDDVARQLARLGTLAVSSSARAPWSAATSPSARALGREFGPTILLRLSLARVDGAAGDSLEVRPTLLDQASQVEHEVPPIRFTAADARDVASAVTAAVVGALFRVPEPMRPHSVTHAVDPESFRLTLDGWHQFFSFFDPRGARTRFEAAIRRDPLNARAWAGLTTSWAAQLASDQVPADEAYANASAGAERAIALDSLEGTAWADLALVRMAHARRFDAGAPFLQRAITADPSNPEVYLVAAAMYRGMHRWDDVRAEVREARALDPLNPFYLQQAAHGEVCADRPAAVLALADEGIRADSTHAEFWHYRVLALSRLGRYDEAIAAWRGGPIAQLPPPVRAALDGAQGATGFWTAWRAQGRWNLARLRAAGARGWVSPDMVAAALIQAGDTAAGWRALDARVPARGWFLYKLPCNEQFAEVRDTPQFAALLARVGTVPER